MTRPLSDHEVQVRDERRASHQALCDEHPSALRELAIRLGLDVDLAREQWAGPLGHALAERAEEEDPAAMVWWMARVGHWVAAYLVDLQGGRLLLDEDPSAQTFLRTVVGDYQGCGLEGLRHDPFRIAAAIVAERSEPARLLQELGNEIEKSRKSPNSRE